MKAKVVLIARVKVDTRRYDFRPVGFKKGKPVAPPNATTYYLRYSRNNKRVVEPVGPDLPAAFVKLQKRELDRTRKGIGLSPFGAVEANHGQIRIKDAIERYIGDLEGAVTTGEKAKRTLQGYKKAVEDFRDHCGVMFLDEITADILKKHKLYLFGNIKKQVRGKTSNTVSKRFRFLNAFFHKQGIKMTRDRNIRPGDPGLIDYQEIPKQEKPQNVSKYSSEEIKSMLSVADEDEADLVQFFLRTGCRDGETSHLEWQDIDFKMEQIQIREKPGIWRPKEKEQRTIPVEDGVLLKRLEERKKRQNPVSRWVFPNTSGDPDQNLILYLHRIVRKAKRQGLNFEGTPTNHRFRRTYASMMISHTDLQTVSALLGHSDIQTTSGYLEPDQAKAKVGTRIAFRSIDID